MVGAGRRMAGFRVATAALLVCLGAAGLSACSDSPEEERADYCGQVSEHSTELTRIADEEGATAFLTALPILEGLRDAAPRDLVDEWTVLLNALHGMRDALDAAGLAPSAVTEGLPEDLAAEDRRRITGAASVLASAEVRRSTSGIEQHALDVCGVSLL